MPVCRKCLVAGRVQGVSYRAAARHRARELGVTGYARNLPDGRVEVLACGEPADVEALCEWLWEGPPMAKIAEVVCTRVEEAAPAVFYID